MHWFIDPIKNQYADFSGRTTRHEFGMFLLMYIIVAVAVSLAAFVLRLEILTGLFNLAMFIPVTAIGARRLHDIGKSGWWQLIWFIPLVGLIILIVWLSRKSTEDNEYGPRAATAAQVVPPTMDTAGSAEVEDVPMTSETTPEAPEEQVEENTQKGFGA